MDADLKLTAQGRDGGMWMRKKKDGWRKTTTERGKKEVVGVGWKERSVRGTVRESLGKRCFGIAESLISS